MNIGDQVRPRINFLILLASPNDQVADKIMIADVEFKEKTLDASGPVIFAKHALKFTEKEIEERLIWVNSWNEAKLALRKFKSVERLYFYVHGESGQLRFGQTEHSIDELVKSDDKLPKINTVFLEACNVATDANRVFKFAQQLNVKEVYAWNQYRVPTEFSIPAGSDEESIRQMLQDYGGYLIEGTPSPDKLAKHKKPQYIGVEWFRTTPTKEALPKPGDLRRKYFRRRMSARTRIISSEVDAMNYEPEQHGNPISTDKDLDRVIFKPLGQ